ncbi:unnamed protein product [marine sediment metagenome]|uniref:Uncharacterized protein n=1 Tax=marine sediment metagenome TaxID=412755 RepID=X0SKH9_9ZZZZ
MNRAVFYLVGFWVGYFYANQTKDQEQTKTHFNPYVWHKKGPIEIDLTFENPTTKKVTFKNMEYEKCNTDQK